MAPRKKPIASNTTSSKKSNSKAQPQASKFGIQHFFGHHTQNSQKPNKGAASAPPQNPKPLAAAFSSTIATVQLVPKIRKPAQIDGGNPVLVSVNDENRSNSKLGNKNSMLQYTPPENLMAARVGGGKENVDGEASPEISKSKSINRFKFSPGMTSPVEAVMVEKWLPSPTPNTSDRSLVSLKGVGVKRVKPDQDMDSNGTGRDMTILGIASRQSPFRTTPSLSYCHGHDELANGVACNGVSDQMGLRQHKKVSLGPLMFASKFVLVGGSHYQLPPLVKSTEARENGMGVGLFCRLSEAHPQAISALQSQYRMCRGIMELSNALIYGDRLHCASPEIENAKLKVSSSISSSLWIQEVINPSKPVIFINTDSLPAFEEKGHKIVSNPTEANIIVQVVEGLVKSGIKGEDIGVITPYNSQVDIIWLAFNRLTSVEVHTIDKYQKKLIMVGSCKTISKVVLMKLLIEQVEQQSGILNVSNKDIKFNSELRRCSQSQAQVR